MLGDVTLEVEVTNVSKHGLWLFTRAGEKFLAFDDFPWFRNTPIGQVTNLQEPTPDHFYWPDLDVDLSLKIIERPQDYPLKSHSA